MARYLDGLKRKPRQAHLSPGLKETLMAKIGANIVGEFLKKEYQTYHDGRGRPELDDNDAWWNCLAFPTKCLWDDFHNIPMDNLANALARAMLEMEEEGSGDCGTNRRRGSGNGRPLAQNW